MTIALESFYAYDKDQHCTFPYQDGVEDYSFAHTAGYCGKPQERLCACGFCYGDQAHPLMEVWEESESLGLSASELNRVFYDASDAEADDDTYRSVAERVLDSLRSGAYG